MHPAIQAFLDHKIDYLFITGGPGTGKSTLLQQILPELTNYALCSTTGASAALIGGKTVHSAFGFPILSYASDIAVRTDGDSYATAALLSVLKMYRRHGRLSTCKHKVRDLSCRCFLNCHKECEVNQCKLRAFRDLEILIIDEISMLSRQMLRLLSHHLNSMSSRSYCLALLEDEPLPNMVFGGKRVIICGDLLQLPPVPAHDLATGKVIDSGRSIATSALLNHFEPCYLTQVYRCKDDAYLTLLHKLRHGEIGILEMRDYLDQTYSNRPIPELSVHIFFTKRQVADMCNKWLELATTPVFDYPYMILNQQGVSQRVLLAYIKKNHISNLRLVLYAPVMVVRNIYSGSCFISNGDIGKVVELDETSILVRFAKRYYRFTYLSYTIPGTRAQIRYIPLTLAIAITHMKAQGVTIFAPQSVVAHVPINASRAAIYVVLSRVELGKQMYIEVDRTRMPEDRSMDTKIKIVDLELQARSSSQL